MHKILYSNKGGTHTQTYHTQHMNNGKTYKHDHLCVVVVVVLVRLSVWPFVC